MAEETKRAARGAAQAGATDRKASVVLARALWLEQEVGEDAGADERKERQAAWKAQSKEDKKSVVLLARRVLKRLEKAGFRLVHRP